MRVIAGAAKGHPLQAPPGTDTRPTTDRVKEALFSMLQPDLPGAEVLDLYAGSGALGIEALSRGAEHAVFVERSRRACDVLRANLATTDLADRATILRGDAEHVLGRPASRRFHIVLLDPPYSLPATEVVELFPLLRPHLARGAIVTLERGVHDEPVEWPAWLRATRDRHYGDTRLQTATYDDPEAGRA
ncbi:MAG: 16S rRNA (guanine(966)-N(2))-methyltransferase RsmD [Nitriliruptorales bacterium]|nr:16S rRNA (guanine(966)-N(2))-methyltransferase RsmD [Nitriliruptorales bacterium]